jgi:hypothetical protein
VSGCGRVGDGGHFELKSVKMTQKTHKSCTMPYIHQVRPSQLRSFETHLVENALAHSDALAIRPLENHNSPLDGGVETDELNLLVPSDGFFSCDSMRACMRSCESAIVCSRSVCTFRVCDREYGTCVCACMRSCVSAIVCSRSTCKIACVIVSAERPWMRACARVSALVCQRSCVCIPCV